MRSMLPVHPWVVECFGAQEHVGLYGVLGAWWPTAALARGCEVRISGCTRMADSGSRVVHWVAGSGSRSRDCG
eukprot:1719742-Alexandrium_andersonii.AAC.1